MCLLLAGSSPLPRSAGAADGAEIAELQAEPSTEQQRWHVTCCASPSLLSIRPSVSQPCPAFMMPVCQCVRVAGALAPLPGAGVA